MAMVTARTFGHSMVEILTCHFQYCHVCHHVLTDMRFCVDLPLSVDGFLYGGTWPVKVVLSFLVVQIYIL